MKLREVTDHIGFDAREKNSKRNDKLEGKDLAVKKVKNISRMHKTMLWHVSCKIKRRNGRPHIPSMNGGGVFFAVDLDGNGTSYRSLCFVRTHHVDIGG